MLGRGCETAVLSSDCRISPGCVHWETGRKPGAERPPLPDADVPFGKSERRNHFAHSLSAYVQEEFISI